MTRVCPVCKRPCTDYNADYCLCGQELPEPRIASRDSILNTFTPNDYDDN